MTSTSNDTYPSITLTRFNPSPSAGSGLLLSALSSFSVGVVGLIGWHTNNGALLHIHPSFLPLQYNTAFACVILACGFFLALMRRRSIAAGIGGLVTLYGIAIIAEYALNVDAGLSHPVAGFLLTVPGTGTRIAAGSALSLALSGVGLLLVGTESASPRRPFFLAVIGAILVTRSLLTCAYYTLGQSVLLEWFHGASLLGALGFLGVGAGLVILAWKDDPAQFQKLKRWRPLVAGIASFAAIGCLWQADIADISQLKNATLVLGVLLSVLVTIAFYFMQSARNRAKKTEAVNRELRKEIQHRHRIESSFAYQTQMLQLMLANLADGVLVADEQGRILLSNAAARRITDFDFSNTTPYDWSNLGDLFLPDQTTPYPTNDLPLLRAIRGESVDHAEIYARFAGKTEGRWITTSARPLLDEQGAIRGGVTVFQDVTERKVSDEALNASQRQMSEAQQLAHVGSWTWDLKENKIAWSDELFRIFGIERSQFSGTVESVQGRVHPGDVARFRLTIMSARDENQSFSMDYRTVRPDGEIRHLHSRGEPVKNAAGEAVKFVGTSQDVTERVRAHEELEKARASLEIRVEERTRDLEEAVRNLEEEVALRKKAERMSARRADDLLHINKELEQFAFVASHDLQEPLRKVSSYAQLLADRYRGRLDEKADVFISYMVDGVIRMQQLITDLLAYSRATKLNIDKKSVDLNSVIRHVLHDLEPSVMAEEATIRVATLPVVRANEFQMQQLFQNLIGNALKFRGPERPVVEIGAERKSDEWIVFVRDNGIGIEPQYAERIFQIFQRLHTRNQYPGTGIGLAICKKIVEGDGGRLWVESAPGAGSVFFFSMLAAIPAQEPSLA